MATSIPLGTKKNCSHGGGFGAELKSGKGGGGERSSGRAVEGGLTRFVNTLLEKGEKETAERAERGRLGHKGGRERNRHKNKQADRLVNTRTVSREVHTDGLRKETLIL